MMITKTKSIIKNRLIYHLKEERGMEVNQEQITSVIKDMEDHGMINDLVVKIMNDYEEWGELHQLNINMPNDWITEYFLNSRIQKKIDDIKNGDETI